MNINSKTTDIHTLKERGACGVQFRKRLGDETRLTLTATGFTWAGGQQKAPGKLTATFTKTGATIEWDVTVEMDRAIKTLTTVVRDVPRGQVSVGGGPLTDPKDGDILGGYTFGAGDLHGAGTPTSMSTPVAIVQAAENDFIYFSTHDDHVRPKRYYFQAGEPSVFSSSSPRGMAATTGTTRTTRSPRAWAAIPASCVSSKRRRSRASR